MKGFENLEPKNVFKWFYEISQIPRGSGNEKAISDFLVKFAKDRNLEVYQDAALNVIIKKHGSKGFENSQTVILQGHMDMVCEQELSGNHDFLKDPIEWELRGNMLYAKGTTLGGDDGIAVAYALAILDAQDIPHPPLEVLITTEEETGMGGAMALSGKHLNGKRLLNIDSEEEGVFLVSCAGGANASVCFDISREQKQGKTIKIEVSGLSGGHSGMEIVKQRANALKILARILNEMRKAAPLNIVEIAGGSKHNAIPKNAYCIAAAEDFVTALNAAEKAAAVLKAEYRTADKNLTVRTEEVCNSGAQMFTKDFTDRLIDFMIMVPDAVQYMNMEIRGLVQTSLNNAVLEETGEKMKFTISIRSGVKSSLDEVFDKIFLCAARTGGICIKKSEYPAWEYDPVSPVRDIAVKTYEEVSGKKAEITAIHAGLECGLLKKALPGIDAVSFGPNLYDVHTPEEHMDIESVERVWKFLLKYLENLK